MGGEAGETAAEGSGYALDGEGFEGPATDRPPPMMGRDWPRGSMTRTPDVWADTGFRSARKEALWVDRGPVSRIHRKKPKGRPMAARTRRADARKSAGRAAVEQVFARQKRTMGRTIRTIGIARAAVKSGLANLAYNIRRYVWRRGRELPA
jgi:IS5 family transposase